MELIGREYLIDHCISALRAYRRSEAFQEYVADSLMYLGEAVANALGGSYIPTRFGDLFDDAPKDERTADEIALDIIKRAGLQVR